MEPPRLLGVSATDVGVLEGAADAIVVACGILFAFRGGGIGVGSVLLGVDVVGDS